MKGRRSNNLGKQAICVESYRKTTSNHNNKSTWLSKKFDDLGNVVRGVHRNFRHFVSTVVVCPIRIFLGVIIQSIRID